jgi:flavin reductase (DIM6/NTAB) family NADH-FMN oxidoreductase RutF
MALRRDSNGRGGKIERSASEPREEEADDLAGEAEIDRMKIYKKKNFPISNIRRFLEPGPIVLVSSAWKRKTNIMTLGWHTVMEFSPSLVGCVIANSNFSFELIRRSRECVLNVPSLDLVDEVVGIGNCSGDKIDKFSRFHLTPVQASEVAAPLIAECFVSLECRIADTRLINTYNFFIFEVLKAHVATTLKGIRTMHYQGKGAFMASGNLINKQQKFTKWKHSPYF